MSRARARPRATDRCPYCGYGVVACQTKQFLERGRTCCAACQHPAASPAPDTTTDNHPA